MDKKATNRAMYDYIIEAVDTDGYDIVANTDKQKIQFIWDTFKSEKRWSIPQIGVQKSFIDWLQGIPSSFRIDFENYAIIEKGKEFGFLKENATEKQEDKFLESWWAKVFMGFVAAARKNKVELSIEKLAKGGPVSKHDEEIKKLKAVVNSKNIGESLKAKAQARIDMLEEKAQKSKPTPKTSSAKKAKSTPKTTPKQKKKVAKVMKEFKEGDLTSHGKKVKNKKQAVAIALSEAGVSKKKKKPETVFGYAKRTQKSGEAWKDAIKRASKELKNGGKPVAKKIKRTERKPKPVAKKIKRTPAKSKTTKTAKVIKRVSYLNGGTKKSVDKKTAAMHPGKRISKSGSTYYEYRANRADLNKTKKLAEGGTI